MPRLPELETPRLRLTLPPPEAAPRMVAYFERNRDHLRPWEPRRSAEFYTEAWWRGQLAESRREFAEDRSLRLVLVSKEGPGEEANGEVLGLANFTSIARGPFQACLLGYSLDAGHEGRGLMFEALKAALAYVFHDLALHRVMANYQPSNERSGRLLRRLGFQPEGYARDYLRLDGEWRDHVLTALTNKDWTPQPG